jgi:serine/threonine-protein kinase
MVGKTVSKYEILAKAGEGGMGVVYRGRDSRLGREVALKFLFPEMLQSVEARARFEREARTISSVSHPNIATLYAFEDSPDGSFLVFEYLSGGSLADRLSTRGRPLPSIPLRVAFGWAVQIAEGLAHAHRRGIVHRDIKPANVLFDAEDRVKLSDFGLAKAQSGEAGVTRTGVAVGTAAYMSPEQALGAEAGPSSDIYSFGVLLYELFTSRRPCAMDDSRGAFYHVLHTLPAPPRALRPDLPEVLNALILRCLEKRPDARPASMNEVAVALRDMQSSVADSSDTLIPDHTATQTYAVPAASREDAPVVTAPVVSAPIAAASGVRRRWWMVAVMVALLGGLALSPARDWLMRRLAGTALPKERKLAVLLFESFDGTPEQDAFCVGLTDSLTAVITQMGQADRALWVVPSSEIRSENVRSIRDARRLFGVNLAITGSLRRRADRVTVTVNLVDAEQSRQVQARTVELASAELPELEPRIVQAVGSMLQSNLASAKGGAAQPAGLAASAYEHYLQGRGFLQRFDLAGNLDRATEAFETAIALQPSYALALAGLGEAYLARHSLSQDPQWLARAQVATKRAIKLDANLAAAQVNLSTLFFRTSRFQEAIEAGRLARDLDPLNADAYRALAQAYSAAGENAEAEKTYKHAIDLRPGFWLPYKDLGVHYLNLGRMEDAERLFRKVIQMTPDNEWGYRNLATVHHFRGEFAQAELQILAAVSRKPTGESYSNLGTIYYVQGRFAEAAEAYRKATELSPNDPIVWGNLGDAWRAAGTEREKAADVYRRAIDLGERQLQINAKDPQILLGLALYSAKLGEHRQAAAYLARAGELIPGRATLYYQSAIIQELSGQRELSLRSLARALDLGYPADEAAREPELTALRGDVRYQQVLRKRAGR